MPVYHLPEPESKPEPPEPSKPYTLTGEGTYTLKDGDDGDDD